MGRMANNQEELQVETPGIPNYNLKYSLNTVDYGHHAIYTSDVLSV